MKRGELLCSNQAKLIVDNKNVLSIRFRKVIYVTFKFRPSLTTFWSIIRQDLMGFFSLSPIGIGC